MAENLGAVRGIALDALIHTGSLTLRRSIDAPIMLLSPVMDDSFIKGAVSPKCALRSKPCALPQEAVALGTSMYLARRAAWKAAQNGCPAIL
jgi:hypothetical protein